MEYERSATVHAAPATTYDYLANPRHLTEYVATMAQAEPSAPGHLHVAADVHGRHEEGDATFRADPAARRLEWGGDDGRGYHGWLNVTDGDMGGSARVTIHLSTRDEADRAEIEQAIEQTLANIERELAPRRHDTGPRLDRRRRRFAARTTPSPTTPSSACPDPGESRAGPNGSPYRSGWRARSCAPHPFPTRQPSI